MLPLASSRKGRPTETDSRAAAPGAGGAGGRESVLRVGNFSGGGDGNLPD